MAGREEGKVWRCRAEDRVGTRNPARLANSWAQVMHVTSGPCNFTSSPSVCQLAPLGPR